MPSSTTRAARRPRRSENHAHLLDSIRAYLRYTTGAAPAAAVPHDDLAAPGVAAPSSFGVHR